MNLILRVSSLPVLPAGTIIDGRYEILAPLAEGGMGAVFKARRVLLGDDVAIKIVRAEFGRDPSARERFLRESRASAQLRHPNIVSILDYDLDEQQRPFLVMELLNGGSIRDELRRRGPFSIAEVRAIITPICAALQLAHDHGIIHRDLKPANLVAHDFGSGTRTHKIVDFGLVRDLSSDATRLTEAHQFLGTLTYAAPEQITGGEMDARSDQYSLAVVIYEMLTGRPPFEGLDPAQLATAVFTAAPQPPSALRSDLPKWMDVVLGRALAKQPGNRYPSMTAFASALHAGATDTATTVKVSEAAYAGGLLGTYELGETLGPGRLGSEVFVGTHRALGHPVAIRLLRRTPERNWEAVRGRFLREAKTMQVAHPSVIHVRDFGQEGDLVYLVTDFIQGPSLRQLLVREGAMPWTRLEPLLNQLVDAARVLHKKGGLLCGVSPDIIRVTIDDGDEQLKISTAGVWEASDLLATLNDATLRGAALGDVELHYVAPELLTGQHADVRSDVFSMGVLAYEMATATLPYEGPTMPALLGAMLRGRPVPPRETQPTLPQAASDAILKALAPEPADRFASAKAFGAALAG